MCFHCCQNHQQRFSTGAKCGNKSLCSGCHPRRVQRCSRSLLGALGPVLILPAAFAVRQEDGPQLLHRTAPRICRSKATTAMAEESNPVAIFSWDQISTASFFTPASKITPEPQTLRLCFSWKDLFCFSLNQTTFLKTLVLGGSLRRALAGTRQTERRTALKSSSVADMLFLTSLSQHLALHFCFSEPS